MDTRTKKNELINHHIQQRHLINMTAVNKQCEKGGKQLLSHIQWLD